MSQTIIITDRGMGWYEGIQYLRRADEWAETHCMSYRGMNMFEVDDLWTTGCNHSANYHFDNDEDAAVFKLRWQR